MIKLSDGRVALLAYTALDRLIDACGEEQPWMLATTESLQSLHAEKPFDLRLLDVTVPESFRPLLRGES